MRVSGGVYSRPQNSTEILRNGNSTSRAQPRVSQELDYGEMDDSIDEMSIDELQEQEVSCLSAVFLNIVDKTDAKVVEDDPVHTDN